MDIVTAIEAHDLYRFYHVEEDETLALRGVSLSIAAGEFVAVTGPSGSGKSTLLQCLAGLDEPDGGWVAIGGERLTRRSEAQRARLRARTVGLVMQSGNLFDHLTVAANLALAAAIVDGPGQARIDALFDSVGIAHRSRARPSHLSGGELARAAIALALINEPLVLLADEPTAEIDRRNEDDILALLRQRADAGQTTLVATHSPRVVAAADRAIHLVDGSVRHA